MNVAEIIMKFPIQRTYIEKKTNFSVEKCLNNASLNWICFKQSYDLLTNYECYWNYHEVFNYKDWWDIQQLKKYLFPEQPNLVNIFMNLLEFSWIWWNSLECSRSFLNYKEFS